MYIHIHASLMAQGVMNPGGKQFTCNAGDTGDAGLIPRSEGSPGRVHGNPLQYSCLEDHMDRRAC